MAYAEPLFWLTMTICSLLLTVAAARALWRLGSASTPPRKQRPSQEPTPSSPPASEIASLQVDQASLFSNLEKLTTTVKRLSSRQGMRDNRARKESASAPPLGASKADLLRFYGMSGKVGPAFAQAQLDLESRRPRDDDEEHELH